jgi:hypothetical protein
VGSFDRTLRFSLLLSNQLSHIGAISQAARIPTLHATFSTAVPFWNPAKSRASTGHY